MKGQTIRADERQERQGAVSHELAIPILQTRGAAPTTSVSRNIANMRPAITHRELRSSKIIWRRNEVLKFLNER